MQARTSGERTCWLHIGTHKTGSTWLQGVLAANEPLLKEKGYYLPKAGRINASAAQHAVALELDGHEGYPCPNGGLEELQKELPLVRESNVILSSEEFEYLFCKPHHLSRLKQLIEGAGFEVRVLFFFRDQVSYLNSNYAEIVKAGMPDQFGAFLAKVLDKGTYSIGSKPPDQEDSGTYTFDYRKLVEGFSAVFGEKHVLCAAHQPSIQIPFFRMIGAEENLPLNYEGVDPNHSLGSVAVAALQYLNRLCVDRGIGYEQASAGRLDVIARARKVDRRKFIGVSRSDVSAIEERFAECRKWLLEERGVELPRYTGRTRDGNLVEKTRGRIAGRVAQAVAEKAFRKLKKAASQSQEVFPGSGQHRKTRERKE